jgi:hypothetical protein
MKSNGVQLHEVESTGIHYNLLETSAPDEAAEAETLKAAVPPLAPAEESPPDSATSKHQAGYTELVEALQGLEAHVWDAKKRGEVLQDMVEDMVESQPLSRVIGSRSWRPRRPSVPTSRTCIAPSARC